MSIKHIDTDQLKTLKAESDEFLLVNTLDADHFSDTKIPGSVNIPQQQDDFVDEVVQQNGSKQRLVVVYCASPECGSSSAAAEKLDHAGVRVAEYDGGASQWKEAGNSLAS